MHDTARGKSRGFAFEGSAIPPDSRRAAFKDNKTKQTERSLLGVFCVKKVQASGRQEEEDTGGRDDFYSGGER